MVRGAVRPALILLLALAVASPLATAGTEEADETPRTVQPGSHPLFSQLPTPPEATRLWAQLSSQGDAYLTLKEEGLPLPYTPPASTDTEPALVFQAFHHLVTNNDPEQREYTSRSVPSAWNTTLHPDHPVLVSWRLSSGLRGVDAGTSVPPILITTTVKAIEEDGFSWILATRTVRAQPGQDTEPTEVRAELRSTGVPIPEGARIIVELDWSWARAPTYGALRQPLVTVHPGSYVDLPILDPVRVLSIKERSVSGDLYARSEIAHIFGVENLALDRANLVFNGPGINAQGGRPFVRAPREDGGHVATLDWRIPVSPAHLEKGHYDLFVTARQSGEPGPRIIAVRGIDVDPVELMADEREGPLMLGVAGLGSVVAAVGLVMRRRLTR